MMSEELMIEQYQKAGISPEIIAFGAGIEARLRERFQKIDEMAEYNQMKVILAMQKNKVSAEIGLCHSKLQRQLALLHDAKSTAAAAFTPEGIERRLLSHDISLLNFISIYEAYRDTQLLLIDDRNAVIQSAIDLNEAYGEEIINIR